mmetsp:Transcript_35548/g.83022  ORF Transcript_35548/g.83022 Transcript_35548/m.83022 type:complete len:229 (-) Transcript_35548:1546-2232(-)
MMPTRFARRPAFSRGARQRLPSEKGGPSLHVAVRSGHKADDTRLPNSNRLQKLGNDLIITEKIGDCTISIVILQSTGKVSCIHRAQTLLIAAVHDLVEGIYADLKEMGGLVGTGHATAMLPPHPQGRFACTLLRQDILEDVGCRLPGVCQVTRHEEIHAHTHSASLENLLSIDDALLNECGVACPCHVGYAEVGQVLEHSVLLQDGNPHFLLQPSQELVWKVLKSLDV